MKKQSYLVGAIITLIAVFAISCNYDSQELSSDNVDANKNATINRITNCPEIEGPWCANPGDVLIYTFNTATPNNTIWQSVPAGNPNIHFGQIPNSNTVEVTFGPNFVGGTIQATNSVDDCKFRLTIDLCNSGNPTCSVSGPDCAFKSSSVTYTATTSIANPIYTWSIVSGSGISSTITGQGTATATFQTNGLFNGGQVQVHITNSGNTQNCNVLQDIELCTTGGGGGCTCPLPVIDDILCVSGGHPHWRFEVNGINSSDNITWSVNHGTIHSNPNQAYVIIEPNAGSISGFTVYCDIVRTCSDGSTKSRKAYYTNYYGNACGTGTTGYVNTCSSGGLD